MNTPAEERIEGELINAENQQEFYSKKISITRYFQVKSVSK